MIEQEKIMLAAYKTIRREARDFQRDTSNAELGNYVRGVVDLQTELYSIYELENMNKKIISKENKNEGT